MPRGKIQFKAFQALWNEHNPGDAIAEDGLWGPATAARVDSQYGSATERRVTEFQQAKGLTADGIAGAETIKALEEATGEKLILA